LRLSRRKQRRTKDISDMLLINKHVEEICYDESMYDRTDWKRSIAPRLECNIYRKRFLALQRIGALTTRTATLGEALARVQTTPSLVWLAYP
jgi:hypothetical protein